MRNLTKKGLDTRNKISMKDQYDAVIDSLDVQLSDSAKGDNIKSDLDLIPRDFAVLDNVCDHSRPYNKTENRKMVNPSFSKVVKEVKIERD